MFSAISKLTEVAVLLIRSGANINHSTRLRVTVLMLAAHHGATEVILALLKAGVDVTPRDKHQRTAYKYAQLSKCQPAIDILAKY